MSIPSERRDMSLRARLRRIATCEGMSGRIPEMLELELDKYEELFKHELAAALTSLKSRFPAAEALIPDGNGVLNNRRIGHNRCLSKCANAVDQELEKYR